MAHQVADFERTTGRRLDILRTYHRWDDPAATSEERSVAAGRLLFVDWYPMTRAGAVVPWAQIAAGQQDAQIDRLARQAAAYRAPLLVSFSHEPDIDTRHLGGPEDFTAAFAHVVRRARADGVPNVRWVWDVAGWVGPSAATSFGALWPGDDVVDWIAWDPYNPGECRSRAWRSFAQTVEPFYDLMVAQGHGDHPFMLAEYGSVEQAEDPVAKAKWFDSIPAEAAAHPRLRAFVYFNHPVECDWLMDSSPAAAAAFGRAARSREFAGAAAVIISG